jgi:Glucodextranase, domain B
MRRLALILAPLALAGCGAARTGSEPRVSVRLTAPGDTKLVRSDTVHVRGTVSPSGASVQVDGQDATVEGGTFVAEVALQPGANVIDATATAPGRRADADAIRVTRDVRVAIPQLQGDDPDAADDQLRTMGLVPVQKRGGSLLDRFFPGALQVCATQPDAGALVDPHTTVTVVVARGC